MNLNWLQLSDSYKYGHYKQYPPNTETVYSYFEARKGATYDEMVFFSLQKILKELFVGAYRINHEDVTFVKSVIDKHLGPGVFNEDGARRIVDELDGRVPIRIKAVPEGMPVPVSNVLMTVENTHPELGTWWVTNFVEGALSHVWYGSTVATLSREIKKTLRSALYMTDTDDVAKNALPFMLHDFGFRSVTCPEQAAIGGAAHLVNFNGTDTVPGLFGAMHWYNADVAGFSVPATEHSIMTAEGREGEFNVVERLLKDYPNGILSVVIDSYDYREFIKVCGTRFKDMIVTRDGILVFRPDSGDPVKTAVEVATLIMDYFGYSINERGYKKFNPKVKMLWGDGVNHSSINDICTEFIVNFIAISNIVFGMGGALLQQVHRDTMRCAFKSSYQIRNGQGYAIYKDPIDGSKKSKRGRLALAYNQRGEIITMEIAHNNYAHDILGTVFEDGKLLIEHNFEDIVARASI